MMAAQMTREFSSLNSALLKLMADGEVHSGQELAELLGVSRTAVWKQLGKLEGIGLEVESLKGRGYRLAAPIQLLDTDLIGKYLGSDARRLISALDLHESVASTNSLALGLAQEGGAQGRVVVAEHQTGGRGRRGRTWVSPYASNLYMSLCWEFSGGAAALEGLSLAVGVAVVDALESLGAEGCRLKWPNDVLHSGQKLGGILLEMTGDVSGLCAVVVGIGINVQMPDTAARTIDQEWTDLHVVMGGDTPDRNCTLAAILSTLLPTMDAFSRTGFPAFRERWIALDANTDKQVNLLLAENEISGVARGVNEQGALLLATPEGIQTFYGGEVSLRAVH